MVKEARSNANIINKTKLCFVKADVVHNVGNDKLVAPGLVVESFKVVQYWIYQWKVIL